MAPPSINTQITIVANSNDFIDWHYDGADYNTQLTAGTYDDIVALCLQAQTQMRLEGVGACLNLTVEVDYTTSPVGKVVIDSHETDVFELDWLTGANNAKTTCAIFGFIKADLSGAYAYTSDYQHQYGWYAPRAAVRFGPLKPYQVGGELQIPLSGKSAKIVHITFRHRYEAEFSILTPEVVFAASATTANTNRDLETQWQYMVQGNWFRWREDQTVPGTYTDFYLVEPRDWDALTRPYGDYEAYDIDMRFNKKES